MLTKIKESIVSLINSLGYNIDDNGFYREQFPWLMLRVSNQQESYSKDLCFQVIDFVVDIFSTYNGEKEIYDIKEKITKPIIDLGNSMPEVLFSQLRTFKILDDKATGPVRKHGILNYRFLICFGTKEDGNDGTT